MWSPTSSGRRIAAPMRRRFARQSRDPTCGSCRQVEQQSSLMLHRARHLFIREQTAVINSLRAYLAEFGIVAPVGRKGVEQLLEVVADAADHRLPELARACLTALGSQLRSLKLQILEFARRIMAWHRSNATSKRLDAVPGVGPALATALAQLIEEWKERRVVQRTGQANHA